MISERLHEVGLTPMQASKMSNEEFAEFIKKHNIKV